MACAHLCPIVSSAHESRTHTHARAWNGVFFFLYFFTSSSSLSSSSSSSLLLLFACAQHCARTQLVRQSSSRRGLPTPHSKLSHILSPSLSLSHVYIYVDVRALAAYIEVY